MARPTVRSCFAALTTIAALVLPAGLGNGSALAAGTPIPAHVYAPYFETWTTDSITADAQASGTKYYTLAFLETTGKSSCTLAWGGSRSQTGRLRPLSL